MAGLCIALGIIRGWNVLPANTGVRLYMQGEHKVFPRLQTFITRKLLYVEYKHIFFKM